MTDAKQVGDKQIMQNTKVEAQPASGRIRFATTLPSGRKVESEWIKESSKTQGVLKWCEAVRAEIVADQEEAEAKTKRRLMEERASAPALIVPPGLSGTPPGGPATISSATSAAQNLSSDPVAFIEGQVQAAEASVQRWSFEAQRAQQELTLATNDLRQWQAIRASLLPPTVATGISSVQTGNSRLSTSDPTTPTTSAETIDFSDIDEEQDNGCPNDP